MDYIESACQQDFPCQQKLPEQGRGIFHKVAERTLRLQWQLVAKDVNTFEFFIFLFIAFAGRTDDRYLVVEPSLRARPGVHVDTAPILDMNAGSHPA